MFRYPQQLCSSQIPPKLPPENGALFIAYQKADKKRLAGFAVVGAWDVFIH